jgi:His/Glu/Gln/Arg/opine family amino acid ABC transporter permease subunit
MEGLAYPLGFVAPLVLAAGVTIEVAAGAFVLAASLGLVLATIRFFIPSRIVQLPISLYVEVFRNVPSLTHLFIIFFGLAYVGIRLNSLGAAILGLGLIGGAVLADVFRAGFEAVHVGQREAGLAVGMPPLMVFRNVILPQTWRVTLPPIGNYAIQLVKDTSLVAAIAAPEIMFTARNLVVNTFETTLVYGIAAALYLVICIPLSRVIRHVEQRTAIPR